ncbi:hypothetical protein HHK36_009905 [Tetracentron sinense]|uniref:Uncharacterized protein n=1 Tax=Tetracentron sinense TaxID=13715 RepID=A0A834ZBN6_TETSI|nr:hypothetical protein HHK36_009905 [Tetracentron sinense]
MEMLIASSLSPEVAAPLPVLRFSPARTCLRASMLSRLLFKPQVEARSFPAELINSLVSNSDGTYIS